MFITLLLSVHEQANAVAYKIVRPVNRPYQTELPGLMESKYS
jgi:hypothetical protein